MFYDFVRSDVCNILLQTWKWSIHMLGVSCDMIIHVSSVETSSFFSQLYEEFKKDENVDGLGGALGTPPTSRSNFILFHAVLGPNFSPPPTGKSWIRQWKNVWCEILWNFNGHRREPRWQRLLVFTVLNLEILGRVSDHLHLDPLLGWLEILLIK